MMKLLIAFVALMSMAAALWQPARVIRVIDGDTIVIEAPWVPDPLKKEISVRVYGIDTPELKDRDPVKAQLAQKARAFTQEFVSIGKPQVLFKKWDKYGGRILGAIKNGKDEDLASALLDEGYAKPYLI